MRRTHGQRGARQRRQRYNCWHRHYGCGWKRGRWLTCFRVTWTRLDMCTTGSWIPVQLGDQLWTTPPLILHQLPTKVLSLQTNPIRVCNGNLGKKGKCVTNKNVLPLVLGKEESASSMWQRVNCAATMTVPCFPPNERRLL